MRNLLKPLLLQSFRTGGLYLLIIALSLAISATTALKFSNDQVKNAVSLQASQMLGADLVLSNNEPIEQQWKKKAEQLGLKQTNVTIFSSMAHTQDQFVMVNVKAIELLFPLRGQLEIEPSAKAIQSGEVWLSQRAADLLKVKLGDTVSIADGTFRFSGVIVRDSNQELGFSGFSPTVIIHQADIAKTHAIQTGSRIDYRLLMAGSPEQVQSFSKQFKQQHQPSKDVDETAGLRLRDASESNSRLLRPLENLDTFLQLANILTILLCGIAIALTSQRYVQQNQDHIALIRCLGASKFQILWAYIGLLCIVSAISIVLGSLLGLIMGFGLLQLMLQLIPQLELSFSVVPLLIGPLPIAIFTSVIVLLGFILPSIWELLNTPPIRVIREQAKSRKSLFFMFFAGNTSLVVFSLVLSENLILSILVLAAIIVLCILLYTVVWLLLRSLKKLKNRLSFYIRSPSQSALQITTLALGLSLITVLSVLRTDLLERWQQQLPEGTPNQFVYGLPPFDLKAFEQQLKQNGWQSTPLYPNIRGRLVAKNDVPFSEEAIKQNNSLRRELNLTQSNQLPNDNAITNGQAQFNGIGQVSVESKTAESLGIQIGDKLTFSLPEGNLQAKVVNFRSVEWESFSPNFFFIFSPKTLDENAGSYLGSFYVPKQDQSKMINIIQQFSNTVFIDVDRILDEVKRLMNVLVKIVTVLAALVGFSGILVLIACLNLLMDERRREVALLRSFGLSKNKMKQMLSFEIGFLGLLAGIVACCFAEVISAIASYKMNMAIQWHIEIWLILPLGMMLVCALIGRYRLGYLCNLPPLQSLRELNQL
ncbi:MULTISPECIES: ABC transporter permease [Acinetobacter]|uniref:FtsX-like permease family protein n=1 Tax=Acinetobacter pittii TaxID=48296 RepID=A0AAE9S7I2_ACIPI|nr:MULTISPECIES: FtsX-like permease family protein [Acinetobacter calcoaceticus/baumannii complex]AZP30264.1 ABC transporter permease [Acinetobacter pittii]EXE26680.1 ftsX-like permease family protein [Acinetobacter sp. 907131]EXS16462.1 ftsX-like permease family protein [Acinetobacter sp. 883425]MBK0409940.1 FtsX-like permease family protein [Acinetobacter pittii]MBK1416225.1 FtsX-like permease family protein [Acinetobacter pittii]